MGCDKLQGFLVSLPQFQTELKVRLAEHQLGESERGKTFLAAIEDKAVEGFGDLLALPAGTETEETAE